MPQIFLLPGGTRRHPDVTRWLAQQHGALGVVARHWFEVIRGAGDDVRELMHDGQATACVSGAAFAYVATFKGHVNVGFFRGASLPDPARILEGAGRFMRHVKLTAADDRKSAALPVLIDAAYRDIRQAMDRPADDTD